MTNEQLTEKVCEYARTKLAAKAQSKTVQFLLGAGTVGAGRKAVAEKLAEFTSICADEHGEIDMCDLKESVMAGFASAGSLPVMGGILSLDANDAKEFFTFVGVPA